MHAHHENHGCFFAPAPLPRKASTESDTNLRFGASYKGPDTKSAEVSGKVSALDLKDLLVRLSPLQKPCASLNHYRKLGCCRLEVLRAVSGHEHVLAL